MFPSLYIFLVALIIFIFSNQENANQNHNDISFYTCQNSYYPKKRKKKKKKKTSIGKNAEELEPLYTLLVRMQNSVDTLKTVWRFLKKLKVERFCSCTSGYISKIVEIKILKEY